MTNATAPVIKATDLSRFYDRGRIKALDHINLAIPKGRIVGLIGPNGSGKTTALKTLLGLTPYRGELTVLGHDPSRGRDRLMERVCFIADVATLPRWAKVRQLIDWTEGLHPRFDRATCMTYLSHSNVRINAKIETLSRGMVVQLHLALVMAIDAEILVLDEPTLGLDLLFRKQFYSDLISDYYHDERTIIITTHQVEEVEHILTDLIFIDKGRLVLNASMDDIKKDYTSLIVHPEQLVRARQLGPIHEHSILGRHVLMFKNPDRSALAELGEIQTPQISDLFVALMGKHATGSTT